jgi:hypothetical protein
MCGSTLISRVIKKTATILRVERQFKIVEVCLGRTGKSLRDVAIGVRRVFTRTRRSIRRR